MTTMLDFNVETLLGDRRNIEPHGFPAAHGLLATANRPSTNSRWLAEGVQFTPTLCVPLHTGGLANGICEEWWPPGDEPVAATCPEIEVFPPHVVEALIEYTMPSTVTKQTWLPDRLLLGLSQALEARFWLGITGLGGSPALTIPGTAGALSALGLLEDRILSAQAGAGTLHMSPGVAARVMDVLVEAPDGTLRTRTIGSKVVIGNYAPDKIVGHIGDVDLYLGPSIWADESHDRGSNTFRHHAWVEAALAWHRCGAWTVTVASADVLHLDIDVPVSRKDDPSSES